MSKPRASLVSYTAALSHATADKRIEVLRLIAAGGSISQAGRDAGISYKAAWQAIDTLTNLAGVVLVERAVGGAGGGGARVTAAGAHLLAAADQLDAARGQVLARLLKQSTESTDDSIPFALRQLSVRTSMRNQLPCTVQKLERQGRIVHVRLLLANETALVSRITQESAELLGLCEGSAALALCKATAVAVRRSADLSSAPPKIKPGVNVLGARATRVSRGATGDEVSAQLDSGLQVVGFASPASGLRSGSRVILVLDESAVVIALAG